MRCTCTPTTTCPACLAWEEPMLVEAPAPVLDSGAVCTMHPRWRTITLPLLPRHMMRYRRRYGVKQEELAQLLGCTVRTIRNIEQRRTKRPQRRILDTLSMVLGVTIAAATHH